MDEADDETGVTPEEAFALLANDTRVSALEALWESRGETVPFSELRRHVGVRDAGQFHYHLSKLCDHFVEKQDDGYELTPAGFKIVQAVIAGSGIDTPTVDTEVSDRDCPRCSGSVELRYADGAVRVYCTGCTGFWSGDDEYGSMEPGYLGGWEFPPAGLRGRTPVEIVDASISYMMARTESLSSGVCPDCGGTVSGELDVCKSHESGDDDCPACGRNFLGVIRWHCDSCKLLFAAPSWSMAVQHPPIRGSIAGTTGEHLEDPWAIVHSGYERAWSEELVSTDPIRVAIAVPLETGTHQLTLDETGSICESIQNPTDTE